MEIDLTTPALLFSAISLIMLAYTNRFLSYAQLVRTLKEQYMENPSSVKAAQIANLRKRLYLTRAMTGAGLTVGQYDGLVGTPALSSATMTETTAKVLSKASLQTTTAEVLSKASLQTEEGDFLVSATAVSGSMEVAGMPNVKKSVIKVPDTPGSTFAVVTVMPDGTISGEPGVLHYTNGHMFSISDNWYLEG